MVNLSAYFEKMAEILPEFSKIKVTSFEEGFSNHVYRLDWDNKTQVVLRIPTLEASAFYIDRKSELAVLTMAAKAGLSPEVLWQDDLGAFACRFVSPPSFAWSVKHSAEDIKRIATALMRTHQLPAVAHEFCIYKVIEHYLGGIECFLSERPELREEFDCLGTLLTRLERLEPKGDHVLCHNDLNPKNILMDHHALWLIDWEYSGMGDPLFDLAIVARAHNLDEHQRKALITHYQPSLDINDTLWCLEQYGEAYALREMTWLLLKHLKTPNDPEALGFYYEFKATPSLNPFLEKEVS